MVELKSIIIYHDELNSGKFIIAINFISNIFFCELLL